MNLQEKHYQALSKEAQKLWRDFFNSVSKNRAPPNGLYAKISWLNIILTQHKIANLRKYPTAWEIEFYEDCENRLKSNPLPNPMHSDFYAVLSEHFSLHQRHDISNQNPGESLQLEIYQPCPAIFCLFEKFSLQLPTREYIAHLLWFFWDHNERPGDKSHDWEPIAIIYEKTGEQLNPVLFTSRAHNENYGYQIGLNESFKVYFAISLVGHYHTPIIITSKSLEKKKGALKFYPFAKEISLEKRLERLVVQRTTLDFAFSRISKYLIGKNIRCLADWKGQLFSSDIPLFCCGLLPCNETLVKTKFGEETSFLLPRFYHLNKLLE